MAARIRHETLVSSTVKTVTLTDSFVAVEVINVDGAGSVPVYVTTDGTTPTVAGDECDVVGGTAGAAISIPVQSGSRDGTTVKLIAAGTPKVCVKGVNGIGGMGRR